MQKLADDSTLLQKSLTSDGKYLGGLTCHHLPLPPSELGPGFRGETSGAKKRGFYIYYGRHMSVTSSAEKSAYLEIPIGGKRINSLTRKPEQITRMLKC